MIIAICGLAGSGKGTVADYLVDNHNFNKISFADTVKDVVAVMFDYDRDLLEGVTDESREWREQKDPFWSEILEKDVTPRYIMQKVGTECMRHGFHPNVWSSIVEQKMKKDLSKHWVIPDCRFAGEKIMVRKLGGQIWQIRRGELPSWWQVAMDINSGKLKHYLIPERVVHESEWAWVEEDSKFDAVIHNDTIKNLIQQINEKLNDCL